MEVPKNTIDLRCYYTWMGSDGIARTKVKPNAKVELEDAKENSQVINSLEGDKFCIIVDTTQITSITKEARDHFSMKGRKSKVIAIAIIVKSPLSKIIANFFMGLNKPVVPVKLFNNEAQATDWCKLQKT